MVILHVVFKPNTSKDWLKQKMSELGLSQASPHCSFPGVNEFITFGHVLAIKVVDEDMFYYLRSIRMISPQVVSVQRA